MSQSIYAGTGIEETLEAFRTQYPRLAKGRSDSEVYDLVNEMWAGGQLAPLNLPNDVKEKVKEVDKQLTLEDKYYGTYGGGKTSTPNTTAISPQAIEKLESEYFGSGFVEAGGLFGYEGGDSDNDGIGDWYQEGWPTLGVPAEFFQATYNESIPGLAYAARTGHFKYDVGDYKKSWYAEAGSFLFGTAAPVELATFLGTAGVGGLIGKGAMKGTAKYFAKEGVESLVEGRLEKSVLTSRLIGSALETGTALGAYSAAHALTGSAAQQRVEYGEIDWGDAMWEANKAFLDSFVVGAGAGGVAKGFIGSKWALAQAKGNKIAEGLQKYYMRDVTEVMAEGGLFTLLPNIWTPTGGFGGGENVPTLGSDEWWGHLGTNMLIMGGMKTINKFTKNGTDAEFEQVLGTAYEVIKRGVEKDISAKSKVIENLKEGGIEIRPEMLDDVASKQGEALGIAAHNDTMLKKIKHIRNILIKVAKEDFDINRDLTMAEIRTLGKDSSTVAIIFKGMVENYKKDPAGFFKVFSEKYLGGREMTKTEQKTLDLWIKNREIEVNEHQNLLNKIATGEKFLDSAGFENNKGTSKVKVYTLDSNGKPERQTLFDKDGNRPRKTKEMTVEEYNKKVEAGENIIEVEAYKAQNQKPNTREGQSPSDGQTINATEHVTITGLNGVPVKLGAQGGQSLLGKVLSSLDFRKQKPTAPGVNKQRMKIIADETLKLENAINNGKISAEDGTLIAAIFQNQHSLMGGGKAGRGKKLISPKRIQQHVDKLIELSSFMKERGTTLQKMTQLDLRAFLMGKGKDYAWPITVVLSKHGEGSIPVLKGLTSEVIQKMTTQPIAPKQGSHTGQIKKDGKDYTWSYYQSATGDGVALDVKLPSHVGKLLSSLEKRVQGDYRNKKISTKFEDEIADNKGGTKIENHEYLYWRMNFNKDGELIDSRPLTSDGAGFKGILERLNPVGMAKVNPETFRKSFISWLKNEYKFKTDVDLAKMADELILGHKTGRAALEKAYQKYDKNAFEQLEKAQFEFAKEIETGKTRDGRDAQVRSYEKDGKVEAIATGHMHQILKNLENTATVQKGEHKGLVLISGSEGRADAKYMFKEDIKTLLWHRIYSGSRGTDVMPSGDHLKSDLGWQRTQIVTPSQKKKLDAERKLKLGKPEEANYFKSKEASDKFIVDILRRNKDLRIDDMPANMKETLGMFAESTIYLSMKDGKIDPKVFYHENYHRLKKMAKQTNNQALTQIIDEFENQLIKSGAFGKVEKKYEKYKKEDRVEEFAADIIGAEGFGQLKSKGFKASITRFTNRVTARLKQFFFGSSSLTEKQLKDYLGSRVYSGFRFRNQAGRFDPKFKYGTNKEVINHVQDNLKFALKEIGLSKNKSNRTLQKRKLIEYIAELAGIKDPTTFKLDGKVRLHLEGDDPIANLAEFNRQLSVIDYQSLKNRSDAIEWFRDFKNVEINRIPANITEKAQKNILLGLGVEKGEIWNANNRQLKEYLAIVKEAKENTNPMETFAFDVSKEAQAKILNSGKVLKAGTLPFHAVLDGIGMKDLSRKILTHVGMELEYVGNLVTFETNVKNIVGKRAWEGWVSGKNTMSNSMYLLDWHRYKELRDSNKLSAYEKKFINSATTAEWRANGPKKGDKMWGLTNSNEGRVAKEYMKFMNEYKEGMLNSIKFSLNDAQYEKFIKENNIKWIEDGIYVTRQLTEQFKKKYNPDGKAWKRLVEQEADKIAIQRAKAEHGENWKQYVKEYLMDAIHEVESHMHDMHSFSVGKYSSRFVKRRHPKLPEFIDGVRVYETKYDGTIRKYALGMSKLMANMEIFPELVNLQGFKKPGIKPKLEEIRQLDSAWGDYIVNNLNKTLGIGQGAGMYDSLIRGGNIYANILAKTQLMFPTSGLKNILLGQSQALSAYKARHYLQAVVKAISDDNRAFVKATGATESGLRHLDEKAQIKILDTAFGFGGMRLSENINRYVSVLAGRAEINSLVKILSRKGAEGSKAYKKAERRLENFYKLSAEELKVIKKYGLEKLEVTDFKSASESARVQHQIRQVNAKINTMAHTNTQGSSLAAFMPEVWTEGWAKPLTLYKRMAYAATYNTLRNFKLAVKEKDMGRVLMTLAGPYVTGSVLIGLYEKFLGMDMPEENSFFGKYLQVTLWKGEMLGLFSELLNPYFWDEEDKLSSLYPAIHQHMAATGVFAYHMINPETKTRKQATDEYLTKSFAVAGGIKKIRDRKLNDNLRGYIKYHKLYNTFQDDIYKKPHYDYKESTMSPYFKDLQSAFYKGSEEEFIKQYLATYYAKAHDFYNKGRAEGLPIYSFDDAWKAAGKVMKNKIKGLNPNPGNFDKKSPMGRSYSTAFFSWLSKDKGKMKDEYLPELKNLDAYYYKRLRDIKKAFAEYTEKIDRKKLLDDAGWDF